MTLRILIACAALLGVACGKDTAGPEPIASGSATFGIPALGTRPPAIFSAAGAVELDAQGKGVPGTWAYAAIAPALGWPLDLYATMPSSNGLYHHMRIKLPRDVQAGTVLEITPSACSHPDVTCAGFEFFLNTNLGNNLGDAYCRSVSGPVRVTARSDRRVAGTFRVPVTCAARPGDNLIYAVVEGSFDVPLVDITRFIS